MMYLALIMPVSCLPPRYGALTVLRDHFFWLSRFILSCKNSCYRFFSLPRFICLCINFINDTSIFHILIMHVYIHLRDTYSNSRLSFLLGKIRENCNKYYKSFLRKEVNINLPTCYTNK